MYDLQGYTPSDSHPSLNPTPLPSHPHLNHTLLPPHPHLNHTPLPPHPHLNPTLLPSHPISTPPPSQPHPSISIPTPNPLSTSNTPNFKFQKFYSGFWRTHKINIIANFVVYSLLYLYHVMSVNVKLDISWYKQIFQCCILHYSSLFLMTQLKQS